MGLLSDFIKNIGQAEKKKIEEHLNELLLPTEQMTATFNFTSDIMIFTDRRLIWVDKQRIGNNRIYYRSFPYRSISHFELEIYGVWKFKFWTLASMEPVISMTILDVKTAFAFQRAFAEVVSN